MSYANVADLPDAVRRALDSVGYGRKDIEVRASATVNLSSSGFAGARGFAILVDLSTGQHVTTWGSWGGPNMFDTDNPVDNDNHAYALPANGCAITGDSGGGKPTYAVIHVPASMVDRMLPSAGVELTASEKTALTAYKSLKSAYRAAALERKGIGTDVVDSLVARGLLSRNKAGATTITTDGKNALGDHREYL
jgi:hypothetical protein